MDCDHDTMTDGTEHEGSPCRVGLTYGSGQGIFTNIIEAVHTGTVCLF